MHRVIASPNYDRYGMYLELFWLNRFLFWDGGWDGGWRTAAGTVRTALLDLQALLHDEVCNGEAVQTEAGLLGLLVLPERH